MLQVIDDFCPDVLSLSVLVSIEHIKVTCAVHISETDNNVNYLTKELADYIEKNLSDPFLTVSEIAASVKISETYCRRMFTQNFGVSPKQYLIDMRIKLAKQLLLEDEKLISDIAESCGFGSVYHFSRTFKQATGMSPTEYRRSVNILLKI